MPRLSINIDHVGTLREARKTYEPEPAFAAGEALLGGANGITVHLRQDRRHIKDRDLLLLREQGEEAVVNLDRLPELRAGGGKWTAERLRAAVAACEEVKAGIRLNANLHLALSVLMQRLSRIRHGQPALPPSVADWPFLWRP